jgi:coenzyme F420-0:L-glutamate ligase/coenzyme F420-1:gamma-L-glutamate ligase
VTLQILPVRGLPEIEQGADLAALIAQTTDPLRDGDVVAVTQKAVSKAEGRVVPDQDGKEAWVERETRRVVARRGELVIAETRHGFVCANAGVDESNVEAGFLSLLPEDPDGSAERIREGLRALTGAEVGVVITDTFGRTWRRGLVNVAIGCAGLPALLDLRGTKDALGGVLETTVVALADEVAAAAGLAMGKAEGIPAAVVRGLRPEAPPSPAADMVRPAEEDLFRSSPLAAISARRTVRTFGEGPVPREILTEAAAASLTAPVPHGSRHERRPWTWVVVDSQPARRALLGAMAGAWVRDLQADGTAPEVIARRLARSDELLGGAPALAVPFLSMAGADRYPDERRARAERDMFVLATGASVQNFMLALHAQGFASAWVSSSLFCSEETATAVGLSSDWMAMGTIAVGRPPESGSPPRPPVDPGDHLRFR